jgi:polysaccharide export outer membrane protein
LTELREDYKISSGDVIEVGVDRANELSGTYHVDTAGNFEMNYLGVIAARDKTRAELVTLIANGLRVRYLKNPRVTVVIKRMPPSRSTMFIQGSVRNPGVYSLEGRPSLLRLITLAGGLDKDYGSTAFIFREIDSRSAASGPDQVPSLTNSASSPDAGVEASPRYEMHTVNISALLKGDLTLDTRIRANDIVNVPRTDMFFVTGEVRRPGSFPLREGTTISQALSLAEGTTFKASNKATILRVDPKTGSRIQVAVDLGSVTNAKKDMLIQADDIISVGNSRLKSVADVILRGLGGSVRVPYQY